VCLICEAVFERDVCESFPGSHSASASVEPPKHAVAMWACPISHSELARQFLAVQSTD
jgi:hypothetical protein